MTWRVPQTMTASSVICIHCAMPIYKVGQDRWAHTLFGDWCSTATPVEETKPEPRVLSTGDDRD